MAIIQTRATQLEKFRTCKYRYNFEPPLDPQDERFVFGSNLHKYSEEQLSGNLNDIIQGLLLGRRPVKQRQMILNMADAIANLVEERQLTLVTTELTMQLMLEQPQVLLEGTMDLLFMDKEGRFIIADIKTAASNRTQEHFEGAKQKIIYPAMFHAQYGQQIYAFEYWVVTKTSNPKLNVFTYIVEEDVGQQVMNVARALRVATDSQQWEPNYPNYSCFYCKLREACRNYKVL